MKTENLLKLKHSSNPHKMSGNTAVNPSHRNRPA